MQRIAVAAAEARSFERAAIVMKQVADQGVSAKTIERVVHDVGPEFAERRDADPKTDEALAMRPASPPELAVVECDGGRIRTREPGHGPGVHSTTEGWRETKNAVLIRASRTVSIDDPQPEPPACLCDSEHVAKIAETAASRSRHRRLAQLPITIENSKDMRDARASNTPPQVDPAKWFTSATHGRLGSYLRREERKG